MTDFSIKDKKIIITGGSRGLGYGMAKALYEAGASLVIIARDEKRLQECKTELEKPDHSLYYVAADLGDKESLTKAFQSSLELLGGSRFSGRKVGVHFESESEFCILYGTAGRQRDDQTGLWKDY